MIFYFQSTIVSGAYRDVDTLSITKPSHFIEETLRLKFESYYKPNIDDWNSMKNAKEYETKKKQTIFWIW